MSHQQHTSHGHDHHGHGHHAGQQAKGYGSSGHGHGHGHAAAADAALATDPVCGMAVDSAASKHRAEHGGQTFHFCWAGCRTKFVADPGRYLGGPDGAPLYRVASKSGELRGVHHDVGLLWTPRPLVVALLISLATR